MAKIVVFDRGHYARIRSFLPNAAGQWPTVCVVTDGVTDYSQYSEVTDVWRGDGALDMTGLLRVLDASVEAVVATSERSMDQAGAFRDYLGLPGLGAEETVLFRDKLKMKRYVSAAGVRVPDFDLLSQDAAVALLQSAGRVVIKPRAQAGSIGVVIANSMNGVMDAISEIGAAAPSYMVESYVDGRLFHIDSCVSRGDVLHMAIGESVSPTDNVTQLLPYFDVSLEPGDLAARLAEFNTRVIGLYPTFSGVTHLEAFVDSAGQIFFCEIAARPGGGGTSDVFNLRTGVDLFEFSVNSQLNRPPGQVGRSTGIPVSDSAGYAMIYAHAGTRLAFPDAAYVRHVRRLWEPRGPANVPHSWADAALMFTVVGPSRESVLARLRLVSGRVLAG